MTEIIQFQYIICPCFTFPIIRININIAVIKLTDKTLYSTVYEGTRRGSSKPSQKLEIDLLTYEFLFTYGYIKILIWVIFFLKRRIKLKQVNENKYTKNAKKKN